MSPKVDVADLQSILDIEVKIRKMQYEPKLEPFWSRLICIENKPLDSCFKKRESQVECIKINGGNGREEKLKANKEKEETKNSKYLLISFPFHLYPLLQKQLRHLAKIPTA